MTIKKGIYRHFKGNFYELIGTAKNSETLEETVVYRPLYGNGGMWVRPAGMWSETVEHDGVVQPRFRYVGDTVRVERSCGAVVYRVNGGTVEYLLLHQRRSRNWSFPKGHMEPGESRLDTARREVFEEVALSLDIDRDFERSVAYTLNENAVKYVHLYPALFSGEPHILESEIMTMVWADRETAAELLPKVGYDELLIDMERHITGKDAES